MNGLREFENDCDKWLESEMGYEKQEVRIGDETASDEAERLLINAE